MSRRGGTPRVVKYVRGTLTATTAGTPSIIVVGILKISMRLKCFVL